MSIPTTHPIATGRTSEIYPWTDGTVLKLYYDWCPPEWIEQEAAVARQVSAAGIPCPAAGEIIEQNGRRGLVYERVQGPSLLEELGRRPWRMQWAARLMAQLQIDLHRLEVSGLPSYRQSLLANIQRTHHLSESQRQHLSAQVLDLPESSYLCHADFHPGNILLTSQGPMVIDWMTAKAGDPWADVARTLLIIEVGAKWAGENISRIALLGVGLLLRLYLHRYRRLAGPDHGRLQAWRPIIAAARLEENILPEREALLRMLR